MPSFIVPKIRSFNGKLATSLVPIPIPEIYSGANCMTELGAFSKNKNFKNVLIVTDEIIPTLGLLQSTYDSLKASGIKYHLYDKVTPDPSDEQCAEGARIFVQNKCDAIVAFGGGSSMDCAKLIAVVGGTSNPLEAAKDIKQFTGNFNIGLMPNVIPLIAVPTTAGTGSETTFAAIVSFPKEHRKYNVIDPRLVPPYAFLDPTLLIKLPPGITAATGMDALTHAVESYVSPWRTKFTVDKSLSAIGDIFAYLPECVKNGSNLQAREKTLMASFDAGLAFTRAGVGYVHAIAHQLGALFHCPHGIANALILWRMLDFYASEPTNDFATDALAKMTLAMRGSKDVDMEIKKFSADEIKRLAKMFVQETKSLTEQVGIPKFCKGFAASRVTEVAQRAMNEAHGDNYSFWENPYKNIMDTGYPVPKYMTLQECEAICRTIVDPSVQSQSHL